MAEFNPQMLRSKTKNWKEKKRKIKHIHTISNSNKYTEKEVIEKNVDYFFKKRFPIKLFPKLK